MPFIILVFYLTVISTLAIEKLLADVPRSHKILKIAMF